MKKLLIILMLIGIALGFYQVFFQVEEESDNVDVTTKNIFKNMPGMQVTTSNDIGLITLNGVISFSSADFTGMSTAGSLINAFNHFEDSPVKAVILRINSPGGSIGAVQEVCYAMDSFRAKGKKIVASFKDISASGGYYISCHADEIVANPGTLTGSIGVIMQFPSFKGLFEKYGIKYNTIKSGEFKDIGNMGREMTDREKELLQSCVDDSYAQFVQAVVDGRGIPTDEVKAIADGRIFTGRQAKEKKLVDELGGMDVAIEVAKKIAGIEVKEPKLVKYRPKFNFFNLF
ncbi:MAG: signal peptide peptidase SppA [Candidatus Muiribacterium halophilum]|uniref:Signal peptide peptidase SppA n=1 Tax=Muiribacterium halophilum TaxID=2053465 RepID=A0A2N5ZF16_MUIH1|nr:MAG: signal peptide peptidase SppA [Candidatus Muirbacterium halophilum]